MLLKFVSDYKYITCLLWNISKEPKKYEEAKINYFAVDILECIFCPFKKYFTFVPGVNICFIIVLLTVFCELTIAVHEYDIFDIYFDSLNLDDGS